MSEWKIEYEPDYIGKYAVYRKEYSCFSFWHRWIRKTSFNTLDEAEAEIRELKKFPKYYEWRLENE